MKLPITKRKLSEEEIAAAKELYFGHKPGEESLIARTMIEQGWAKFRLSELVGNTKGGMRGLAPGLGWKQERQVREEAARAEETIPDERGKTLATNGRELTRIESIPSETQSRKEEEGGFLKTSFPGWLKVQEPRWVWNWRYQRYIYPFLDRVARGKTKRLMIFLPPRHGKSELVTVRFAVWMLLSKPETKIIIGSYNQKLANRFSRKVRRIYLGADVSDGLPPGGLLNTADDWETTAGGGVKAVGVGAGVTGFGADLIIIDDPIKSRAEANSENNRERIWEWFNDDLHTRLEPKGAMILIQTRWHEDDLAGRLLRQAAEGGEQWEVVKLPALAEEYLAADKGGVTQIERQKNFPAKTQRREEEEDLTTDTHRCTQIECLPHRPRNAATPPNQGGELLVAADKGGVTQIEKQKNFSAGTQRREEEEDLTTDTHGRARSGNPQSDIPNPKWRDPLGRRPGDALCPKRFSREALLEKKRKMGNHSFEALYQQNPVPEVGGLFQMPWFRRIVVQAPPGLKWYRGYDLAVSTRATADYTATARVALDKEGNLYIADVFRMRAEYPDQRKFIIELMQRESDTEHGIEEALHGKAIIQDLRRERHLTRRVFRGVKVAGDKWSRAAAWAARAEEGKVILVQGPWTPDFLDELCHFPQGRHDDQIDAVSIAVQMIEKPKYRYGGF